MAKCKSTVDLTARAKRLKEVYDKWDKNKNIQILTQHDTKYFKSFYETTVHKDFDYGSMPTMGEIRKLERKMNKMAKNIAKKPGKLAEWIHLPENILSKNPITKRYFEGLVMAGNFHRGHLEMITSDLDGMVRLIRQTSRENGVMSNLKINRPSAQKQISKLESEYTRKRKEDPDAAELFYINNLENLDKTNELKVVQAVYDLITNPEKIYTDKGRADAQRKYGTAIVEIASMWTGTGDKGQYNLKNNKTGGMRDKLYEILEEGLSDYVSVLKRQGIDTGTMEQTQKRIDSIIEQFRKQKNYYPTQILDLFPTLAKISESIHKSEDSNALGKELPHINEMLGDIIQGLKLTPNAYLARGDVKRRSKDVISVIDTYAKNVVRFNFTARTTKLLTNAMRDLWKLKGTDLGDAAEFLSRYIRETHSTAIGERYKDSKYSHIAKIITSWQFMNKIGLNPGTVVQNATQSLQNFVYFGGKNWYDSMQFIKSHKLEKIVGDEMKKHGVFFVNLEELAQTGNMLEKTQLIDGEIVSKEPGAIEHLENAIVKIAKITGKPMQWVENKVNRSTTFKLAFSKMYQDLLKNEDLVKKYMDRPSDKNIGERIEQEIIKRSSRYAANMVKELHYEYSPWGKPKLIQTTTGAIAGQFSTYWINFFEYQRKILAEAGDSALAGDWNSPEVHRAARLGTLYMFTEALLTPLTNAKWGNIIENDTKEKIKQLYVWMTGDEKQREKVFFGRGPVLGTFAGPFMNDMITLGSLTGLVKLDEKNWLTYLAGYRRKAEESKDQKMQDAVALLNLQLSKMLFRSIPKWRDGTGFLTILNQDYLYLYNNAEIGKQRENLLTYPQKYGPKMLKPYFTPRKEKKRQAERMKNMWKAPSKKQKSTDVNDLLQSLALLQEGG
jgi:hypothetical protein|tara:strand:- start:339 stop:3023 length:2685 start_codon:yes stop_codon:yes gene_type:complete